MRINLLSIILSVSIFIVPEIKAQENSKPEKEKLTYILKESIPYRDSMLENLDEYARENCQLDMYYPSNKKDFATLVWFHGGGLTGGKKEIPELLKNQGFAVVGVEYRKNPKVKCPVYIEDAAAAVAWVFKNIGDFGGNPEKIFLSGHSAGGYLDLMVGMDKRWLAKYNIDANQIAGLLPLSPQVITHYKIRKERGIEDIQPVIDEFAPIYYVGNGLPPIVLITGDRELEMLGRYEENAYFERMMKLTGHTNTKLFELDGFSHSSMKEPGLYLLLDELKKLTKNQ